PRPLGYQAWFPTLNVVTRHDANYKVGLGLVFGFFDLMGVSVMERMPFGNNSDSLHRVTPFSKCLHYLFLRCKEDTFRTLIRCVLAKVCCDTDVLEAYLGQNFLVSFNRQGLFVVHFFKPLVVVIVCVLNEYVNGMVDGIFATELV